MLWNSHDPHVNTNSTTAKASTFSTRTTARNFIYGTSVLWNAHYPNSITAQASIFSMKTAQHKFTHRTQFPSYPQTPSND